MFKKKPDYSSVELFVGKNTSLKGDALVDGSAIIMGKLEGNLEVKGELMVEKDGFLTSSEIKAQSFISSGRVITDILLANRAEFKKHAYFSGNLKCKVLVVEEGAKIEGNISEVDVQTQDKS